MYDAMTVYMGQAFENLPEKAPSLLYILIQALSYEVPQRMSFAVLHLDVEG